MRLYLSSYGLGDNPQKLVDLVGDNKKTLVINNAQDMFPKEETQLRLESHLGQLRELGFDPQALDLRNYFNKSDELAEVISGAGLIWSRGGNTFILRRAMKQSGFDRLLPALLEKDELVYGGYSAGIIVVTPTLKGIDIVDDPYEVPIGYTPEIIWEGMGLVGFSIAPHYKSDHPEAEKVDETVEYFKQHGMAFKALRDGEVILLGN